MIHKFPYTYHISDDRTIPWMFEIRFYSNDIYIHSVDPSYNRERTMYVAHVTYTSDNISWNRLSCQGSQGLRLEKLFPSELRLHVEKLLRMKVFW